MAILALKFLRFGFFLTFAKVKRLYAYLLVTIVVFNITPVQQLLKMPALFHHFHYHCQQRPSISFVDFLSMHYWGTDENDSDDEEDMKLPFKKMANPVILSFYIPAKPKLVAANFLFKYTQDYPLPNDSLIPDNINSSLFRPPRPAAC